MEPKQAKRLGSLLRKAREAKDLTLRELTELSGVPFPTIIRLEQGAFLQPRPEKLAALANALGLEQARVFRIAGYPALLKMPEPRAYLRAKLRGLPRERIEAIERDVEALLRRHGVELSDGPASGEDEAEEPIITKPKRKGGTR